MVHKHVDRLRRWLKRSKVKCAAAEAKLAEAVLEAQGKLTESGQRLAEAEAKRTAAECKLEQSIRENDMGQRARQACVEEIVLLRKRSAEIQQNLDMLEAEKLTRTLHDYNARRSVLRSFRWKEKEVDPVVLEGAVAFWGATADDESKDRTRKAYL